MKRADKSTVLLAGRIGLIIKITLITLIVLGYLFFKQGITEILVISTIVCIYYAPILNFYSLLNNDEADEHFGKLYAEIEKLNKKLTNLKKESEKL